jgi:response regulator RpfG family c-di-GMP phosphodiesterase
MVADVVQCLTNAVLLAAVFTLSQRVPFRVIVRRLLVSSGVAYVGYGVIGFLFVILWFPAKLEAFSALLVLAPLLAARWAFMQYGEELRSHERTIDTLLMALRTKEPSAVPRSARAAQLAEWVAEELGLGPRQIVTARYASALYEIGHLGVPTRILRRTPSSLNETERRVLERHYVVGSRMIEGIDFLEGAGSGILHQHERFDGAGRPDGLAGQDIPVSARIVAVASTIGHLLDGRGENERPPRIPDITRSLQADAGRFDPAVVAAAVAALEKHDWPAKMPTGPTP